MRHAPNIDGLDHPPLQGEGRTAEGSPGWGELRYGVTDR